MMMILEMCYVLATMIRKSVRKKRAQQFYKGIPEQQIRDREFAIYGTAEDVSRQILQACYSFHPLIQMSQLLL
jgi:hypothetical protein